MHEAAASKWIRSLQITKWEKKGRKNLQGIEHIPKIEQKVEESWQETF